MLAAMRSLEMIDGKRVLVVVPARGGSKGIPLKNIAMLYGKPLIAHTAELINRLDFVDYAMVSTDSPSIANISGQYGLAVPFMRPDILSGDFVSDWHVLHHVLTKMECTAATYDIVVMLQPTCPLRRVWHVEHTVNRLLKGFDSVWTVTKVDKKYHPKKSLRLASDGTLGHYVEAGKFIVARQQLSDTYIRNGAAYAFTRECLLVQQTIMGKRSAAVVIDEPLVNIDTPEDLAEAERLMRARVD